MSLTVRLHRLQPLHTGVELPAATPITLFTVNNASGVTLDKPVSTTTLALTAGYFNYNRYKHHYSYRFITSQYHRRKCNSLCKRSPHKDNTLRRRCGELQISGRENCLSSFSNIQSITTGGTGNATFTAEAFDTGPYAGTAGTGLSC